MQARLSPYRKSCTRLTLLLVFGVVLVGGPAEARPYTVYSCRLPGGRAAATDGWSLANKVGVAQAGDTCRNGGSLYIRFGPGLGAWQPRAWWVFNAPADTRILAYVLYRHVRVHENPPTASIYTVYHGSTDMNGMDGCTPWVCPQPGTPADPLSPANRVLDAPRPEQGDLKRLILELTCWRTDDVGGCPGYTIPGLYVYSSAISLSDDVRPAITSVAGLSDRLPTGGHAAVDIGAVDRGAGLSSVSIALDGHHTRSDYFDANQGGCRPPFTHAVPCPLGGTTRLTWDTTRFVDGFHRLSVLVRDAAGNASTSWSRRVLIDNGGNNCIYGAGPKIKAGLGHRRRKRVWPRAGRRVLLRGRLRDSTGKPIANRSIRLFVRVRGHSRYSLWTSLRTSASGVFRSLLSPGPSRRLRVSYCAPGGGKHTDLKLGVRATAKLKVNKHLVRSGRSVVFSGRLVARPIPRLGKLVELQAYFRGRWRTFETLKTDRRGRFQFRYRFGPTSGRVRYRFRARIPTELGYPFEQGKSRRIMVTVAGS